MPFSRRLSHVVTRSDLVLLLAPTYAKARAVDEEEAAERLGRALADARVLERLHAALGDALAETKGPRTQDDAVVDRVSANVAARRARAKPAEATPALSAVLVWLDLELGLAPESMRDTLASPRGLALLEAGYRELGGHLARELLRKGPGAAGR
jgi:hypothetical protein